MCFCPFKVTAELLESSISPFLLEPLSASGLQRAFVKMSLSESVCEGVKRPPLRIKQSLNPEMSCKENRGGGDGSVETLGCRRERAVIFLNTSEKRGCVDLE